MDLTAFKQLNQRTRQLEQELERWTARAERLGGLVAGDRIQGGERLDLSGMLDTIDAIRAGLAQALRDLSVQSVQFYNVCNLLPSSQSRLLLYRFVDGLTYSAIGEKEHYSTEHARRLTCYAVRAFHRENNREK